MTPEEILIEKGIYYRDKGKDFEIRCLNPKHEDSTPSMRVHRLDGRYNCFTCGYSGNLYQHFNKYQNKLSGKAEQLQLEIQNIFLELGSGIPIPQDAYPVDTEYRDIPGWIWEEFEAYAYSEKHGMQDRIVVPIRDESGKIIALQGRHLHSDKSPKYLFYPSGKKLPLYPNATQINSATSIVLVEGLFDAFYLRSKGMFNAVSTFGTKNITMKTVENLLHPYMMLGLTKVYIMFDGDEAGRNAAEAIKECVTTRTDLDCEIIPVPDGKDPASLEESELNRIKNYLTK